MIKHSSSHAFAVLAGTIIASFLVQVVKPLFPQIYGAIDKISRKILAVFPIPISVDYFTILLFATVLGILWGIFFKLRFDRD